MEGGRPSTSTRMEEGFKFGFSRWLFLSFFWMGVGRVIVNQSNGEIKWPRVIAAGGLPGFVPGFFFSTPPIDTRSVEFHRIDVNRWSHWLWPSVTGLEKGFHQVFLGFLGLYWIGPGFTGFYRVLLGLNGFSPGFSWIYWDLLDFTGFYRVFTRFFLE